MECKPCNSQKQAQHFQESYEDLTFHGLQCQTNILPDTNSFLPSFNKTQLGRAAAAARPSRVVCTPHD